MGQVDARHHLEQLTGKMLRCAIARRRHIELSRISFGIGDEFGDRLGGNRWVYFHDKRYAHHARDGCYVLDEIKLEILVERLVYCVACVDQKKHVAIGRRVHDCLGGNIAAGPGSVLDDELLSKVLRQPMTDNARSNVGGAAWWIPYKPAHWPIGIGLRKSAFAKERRKSRGPCKFKKLAAFKCHLDLAWRHGTP